MMPYRWQVAVPIGALILPMVTVAIILLFDNADGDSRPVTIQESLLRLSDLSAGYTIGDESGCGAITPEGRPAGLAQALGQTFPPFCVIQLERLVQDEGPHQIQSSAVELPSVEQAEAVMDFVPQLGRYVLGKSLDLISTPYDFGDESPLMEFRDFNTGGQRCSACVAFWSSRQSH
jgi:hypothetical protein